MPKGVFKRTPKYYPLPPELRINDAMTLERFGYLATTVSPANCIKKVVTSCEKCAQLFARTRITIKDPVLCTSCKRSSKSMQPLPKNVNNELTLTSYGYYPTEKPRRSNFKVVLKCSCGKRFDRRLKAVTDKSKCRKCEREEWFRVHTSPRENDGATRLLDNETLELYGYTASSVSPKSTHPVVAMCAACLRPYVRDRKRIYDTATCKKCSFARIDQNSVTIKRRITVMEKYPDGLPLPPGGFSQAANKLAERIQEALGRDLCYGALEFRLKNQQRIDILDKTSMVGVEYNGLNWHHEHSKTPRGPTYHYDKMVSAASEGIYLLQVFEDEAVARPAAVEGRILSVMGSHKKVIGARKCSIVPVSFSEASAFLDKWHVQGPDHGTLAAWGLTYKNSLIAVLTSGRHHRQGHETDLVLSRLCFESGTHVTGGTERLFSVLRTYGQEKGFAKIVSWSDNRWSRGNVYARLGFKLYCDGKPDYTYVEYARPTHRISKQSQKKSRTGCPSGITERDWALEHGLSRIWDCGKKTWVFPLTT